jgi:hypothetical protein
MLVLLELVRCNNYYGRIYFINFKRFGVERKGTSNLEEVYWRDFDKI